MYLQRVAVEWPHTFHIVGTVQSEPENFTYHFVGGLAGSFVTADQHFSYSAGIERSLACGSEFILLRQENARRASACRHVRPSHVT